MKNDRTTVPTLPCSPPSSHIPPSPQAASGTPDGSSPRRTPPCSRSCCETAHALPPSRRYHGRRNRNVSSRPHRRKRNNDFRPNPGKDSILRSSASHSNRSRPTATISPPSTDADAGRPNGPGSICRYSRPSATCTGRPPP